MADPRCEVGSNHLIVKNIVRFCDDETKKSCRLVNKMWQTETLKHVWIRTGAYNEWYVPHPGFEALLDKGELNKFRNMKIYNVFQPRLLDYFGSTLKSLELCHVYFDSTAELENVLFNNFPKLKVLTLDSVAVRKQKDWVSLPRGAIIELSPAKAELDVLTIVIGDRLRWLHDKEPGVLVVGLDILFHKFNMIKKLKVNTGDYRPHPDVFAALSQANLAPPTLQFHSWHFTTESVAEYLTTYGDRFLHFEGTVADNGMEPYKNVNVGSWLSVRMDKADLNTFGQGTFANLLKLNIMGEDVENFDFLCRMPVLKEINILARFSVDYATVKLVTSVDRNQPCRTVTKMGIGWNFIAHPELYFHVFPNVTQVSLSCYGQQLPDIVSRWPMLTKLHLDDIKDSEVGEVTRNVMRLKALENFCCDDDDLTFGDAEAEEFLSHPRLTYLRLWEVTMSPLMVELLKEKLVEFEYVWLNDIQHCQFRRNFRIQF